ncbi:hypothetical protein B0H21DRAFT_694941, partial [Amylocystis lapponica]
RGVWNTIEGAGDSLRGGAMDFADSATGTGARHPETDVGAQKAHTGVAQMKGGDAYRSNSTGAGHDSTKAHTASSANPPPLPARGPSNDA